MLVATRVVVGDSRAAILVPALSASKQASNISRDTLAYLTRSETSPLTDP